MPPPFPALVSVDESSDLIELFKLEATYTPDYTSQISQERDPLRGARKIKVEKRWYRGDSLGHGAFGAVWVEHDCNVPDAATAVRAVKEVSKGYMHRIRLDYRREVIALAKLSKYPDEFVQFYGWFEDARKLYLTMEYLPHGDLSSFIEKGMPESEVKLITIQLLEALAIMHENSFTHRDLKPANVFVKSPSPHWWVKIGDFGISKRVRENTALRTEIGTQGFLAPEVVIEGYDNYSNKVDLWSLGCMVFQCLTQTLPFPTIRSLETFGSGGAFPTDPLVAKRITAEGVSFLKTLLVVDPKDRLTAEATLDTGWVQISDHSFRSEMTAPQEAFIKDHENIRIQPQASTQDTEGSTSKESGAIEQQDALSYLHTHGPEPASLSQDRRTSSKLQTLPPVLQNRDDKKPYQSSRFGEDSAVSGPKNSMSQINNQTSDTIKLTSSQGLNELSTNGKALPLRPRDGKKQEGSPIVLHPDIASEHAIQDAHATQLLLENGFDIYADNFDANKTLLLAAAKDPTGHMVQFLLTKGADVAAEDNYGWTALHVASRYGHEMVTRLLLEKGTDVTAKNNYGWTALHAAARYGHETVIRLLLEKGADVAAKESNGWTALHVAARNRHKGVMRLLLEKRADIAAEDNGGRTALHVTARNGHETVMRLLLEKGADVAVKNNGGSTALHLAVGNGHGALVRLLLKQRADVAAKNNDGWTALHLAAASGYGAVVRLLLKQGADVAAQNNDGSTALHLAAGNGYGAVVRLLLEKGANVAAKDKMGRTALLVTARNGHETVIRLLLEKGADVAAKKSNGGTALHVAASYGHETVVRLLLEKGADIAAAEDNYGSTALHRATINGHGAVVLLLTPYS